MSDADELSENPFVALFGSTENAQQFRVAAHSKSTNNDIVLHSEPTTSVKNSFLQFEHEREILSDVKNEVDKIIEIIFLFTLDNEPVSDSDRPVRCVFLRDLKESSGEDREWSDESFLNQAILDRMLLAEPFNHVIMRGQGQTGHVYDGEADEKDVIRYLAQCFYRLKSYENSDAPSLEHSLLYERCKKAVIVHGKLAFVNGAIFTQCDIARQFLDLTLNNISYDSDVVMEFFELVATEIQSKPEDGSVLEAFRPVLDAIQEKLSQSYVGDPDLLNYVDLVNFFTRPALALALLEYNLPPHHPSRPINGSSYETNLFGRLLSISCLTKNEKPPFRFFDLPSHMSSAQIESTEGIIFATTETLNRRMFEMILTLLKHGGEARDRCLSWLGDCLHANQGRAKLSSHHMPPEMFNSMFASDGFFLNLSSVLLQLSSPFSSPLSPKLLKLQSTYCLATVGDRKTALEKNVHLRDVKETTLVPRPDSEPAVTLDPTYNFTTECFYMTHYCLKLGFHVVYEKFMKSSQDMHQIQAVYRDVVAQDSAASDTAQNLKNQMEAAMSVHLNRKAALTQPRLLQLAFNFCAATSSYLTHVAANDADSSQFSAVTFPLPNSTRSELTELPEFLVDNVHVLLVMVHHVKDNLFEDNGELLEHFLTFILVFMGSPQFIRNPHLRAGMAEALEALLPNQKMQQQQAAFHPTHFFREQLFRTHPHVKHLARAVISVFVSIEMTGQGVQFEQKFKYRQPMYLALEYMWGIEMHCDAIKRLSSDAEEQINDTEAPIFLRFLNLLINDAIYLLDEAISLMVKIKENEQARDRGEWNVLGAAQRQELEAGYRHMCMLARFHNIMGKKTIKALETVTRHVKTIFTNNVMVDRVAGMLNYFLSHLVGPVQKNLKVKNFEEINFNPKSLVSSICKIYLNLGDYDRFCLAVSADGRSYSHTIFEEAESVLCKIHEPLDLISHLNALAIKIRAMANRRAEEEELLSDIPDDFLDPIMGTLMREPVLLPSSGKIVDRTTIARHILSDQFDPFNRQPLTMDMVKPAVELQMEIEEWLEKNLRNRTTNKTQSNVVDEK